MARAVSGLTMPSPSPSRTRAQADTALAVSSMQLGAAHRRPQTGVDLQPVRVGRRQADEGLGVKVVQAQTRRSRTAGCACGSTATSSCHQQGLPVAGARRLQTFAQAQVEALLGQPASSCGESSGARLTAASACRPRSGGWHRAAARGPAPAGRPPAAAHGRSCAAPRLWPQCAPAPRTTRSHLLHQRQRARRGLQPALSAVEQHQAQHLLQPRNFAAHRGLRGVQQFGSARDVASLHHGAKHVDLAVGEFHIKSI
jgi:hypothetical protein